MEKFDATGFDIFIRAERIKSANDTKYILGGRAIRSKKGMEAS